MKESFTKKNIENWLVEFLTSPPSENDLVNDQGGWYTINKNNNVLHINKPGHQGESLINLFIREQYGHINNWKHVDLDYFPKRALALLAIIHRPAYEYYKKHWIEK